MTDKNQIEIIADSEVDLELSVNDLNQLNLEVSNLQNQVLVPNSSNLNNVKMPGQSNTSTVERSEVQLLLQAIPEYHPDHNNLSVFIQEVDNLAEYLQNRLTSDLVYAVNFSIRSKIKGDARDFITYQNATQWSEIRTALLSKYGDQRSEDLLISALTHCVQKRNETYLDFYSRTLKALNDLMQYISLNETDKNFITYKKADYQRLALKTFQIGLIDPYRSYLSHFQLSTIEECLNKCKFYDNRRHEWDYCEFLRKTNESSIPRKPQPQMFSNQFSQNFPAQPRQNFLALPAPQNRFNPSNSMQNNQSIFSRPSNSFNQQQQPRPFTGNFQNKLPFNNQSRPPPEPMSTRTILPSGNRPQWNSNRPPQSQFPNQNQNFQKRSNIFQSTGPPNWSSKELFNLETENSDQLDQPSTSEENYFYEEYYEPTENFEQNPEEYSENFQETASQDPKK